MPKPYDIYERLAKDYATPRQYSGYSSGAPVGDVSVNPMDADILGQMQENAPPPPPPRMDPRAFGMLAQGRAPQMPGMTPQDRMQMQAGLNNQVNAFRARNLMPGAAPIMPQGFTPPEGPLPQSTELPVETRNYQGPPMPQANALRDTIYPYMQRFGLAR